VRGVFTVLNLTPGTMTDRHQVWKQFPHLTWLVWISTTPQTDRKKSVTTAFPVEEIDSHWFFRSFFRCFFFIRKKRLPVLTYFMTITLKIDTETGSNYSTRDFMEKS